MAPDADAPIAGQDHRKTASDPEEASGENALRSKLSRKRTKTGCLTCRKRRIKCGEERPVCKNCIKSRRHCEGYNQRVVFKQPAFDPRPGAAHFVFNSRPIPGPSGPLIPGYEHVLPDPAYAHLRPRPLEQFAPGFHEAGQPYFAFDPTGQAITHAPTMPLSHPPQPATLPEPFHPQAFSPAHMPFNFASQAPGMHLMHAATYPPQVPFMPMTGGEVNRPTILNTQWVPHHLSIPDQSYSAVTEVSRGASPTSSRSSQTHAFSHHSAPPASAPPWQSAGWSQHHEMSLPSNYPPMVSGQEIPGSRQISTSSMPSAGSVQDGFQSHNFSLNMNSATDFLRQAAVETQDDDYYDLHSDEEMEAHILADPSDDPQGREILGKILEINNMTLDDVRTRRADSFNAHGGVLERYRVEEVANPLRNPATARLFAHFVSVTGPSLSLYERHPRNAPSRATEEQTPISHQGLWSYTMPMAALRHQGLLHAMLALASLHIARLYAASMTPSMQHYAWALKRIHNSVGKQLQNRLKLTTIAASMLLGYYEIIAADHVKWNTHLAGSKQLFLETDFVAMMQEFKRMKADRAARLRVAHLQGLGMPPAGPQEEVLDQIPEIDEQVLSQLVGKEVRYNTPGFVETRNPNIPIQLDLKQFELLKDLYWWYLKQDAYQSFISGNPLLLDLNLWANCPPRAPLGQPDAVYGSFDHLVLLMGRVADFSSRDRVRKLKVIEANGGQWKPAPGMNMSRTPLQTPPLRTPTSEHPPAMPQGPQFYGMAPPPRGSVQMPASYRSGSNVTTPQATVAPDPLDLHASTQLALEEYGRIRAALHLFAQSLGESFKPISPSEYQKPLETPFGTAHFYRSSEIGCLWALYYTTVTIAIRSHPHMHPAAHVSAGLAAQETAYFANEIGRITSAMYPPPIDQPLDPTTAAALCESCIPAFFAAVQYQTPPQRRATVSRIANIAARTGWGSAEVIANGCETAWVKAAEAGRGPPYQRIARRELSADPRVNGASEQLDPLVPVDEKDEMDRRVVKSNASARLNFAIGVMGMEYDEAGLVNG